MDHGRPPPSADCSNSPACCEALLQCKGDPSARRRTGRSVRYAALRAGQHGDSQYLWTRLGGTVGWRTFPMDDQVSRDRLDRRTLLRRSALATLGATALAVVGCGNGAGVGDAGNDGRAAQATPESGSAPTPTESAARSMPESDEAPPRMSAAQGAPAPDASARPRQPGTTTPPGWTAWNPAGHCHPRAATRSSRSTTRSACATSTAAAAAEPPRRSLGLRPCYLNLDDARSSRRAARRPLLSQRHLRFPARRARDFRGPGPGVRLPQ